MCEDTPTPALEIDTTVFGGRKKHHAPPPFPAVLLLPGWRGVTAFIQSSLEEISCMRTPLLMNVNKVADIFHEFTL